MAWLLSLLLALVLLVAPGGAAEADQQQPLRRDTYRCGGEPLQAEVFAGAVDAVGIPSSSAGTPPGAFVVLQWRGVNLQLPRTNNAGAPSYTDGRWWWSADDPDHPRFQQRRGGVQTFACERDGASF